MPEIRQGCAQTHTFTLPSALLNIKSVKAAYMQQNVELTKECQSEEEGIYSTAIKENESLLFEAGKEIMIQIKVILISGDILVSKPIIAECTRGMKSKIN